MAKRGQPTKYDEALTADLLDMIAGGLSLEKACKEIDGIAPRTIYYWLKQYPEFKTAYENAREQQADAMFDQCLAIADGEGEYADIDVKDRRLMVDTRKWAAGKLQGRYSERSTVDLNANVKFTGLDVSIKRD